MSFIALHAESACAKKLTENMQHSMTNSISICFLCCVQKDVKRDILDAGDGEWVKNPGSVHSNKADSAVVIPYSTRLMSTLTWIRRNVGDCYSTQLRVRVCHPRRVRKLLESHYLKSARNSTISRSLFHWRWHHWQNFLEKMWLYTLLDAFATECFSLRPIHPNERILADTMLTVGMME